MAVKYFFEYTSTNGDTYRCEIASQNYSGASTEIDGNVVYGLNSYEGVSHPIKSKYLKLELLASIDQDFQDLDQDEERYWNASLFRNSELVFFGYLTSEGIFQDFNSDKWIISIDVLSPIAFLGELSYVDDLGAGFSGVSSIIQILSRALIRGFADSSEALDILTYCPLEYTKMDSTHIDTGLFLEELGMDQELFYDSSSGEYKDCKYVIESVLDGLGLAIIQYKGSWLIYDPLFDMSSLDTKYINTYNSLGVKITDSTLTPFTASEVFQHINIVSPSNSDKFYVNKNQRTYSKRSLSAIAIDHEFKYPDELLENPDFTGATPTSVMPGWTIVDSGTLAQNDYLEVPGFQYSNDPGDIVTAHSDYFYVTEGEVFKILITAVNVDDPAFVQIKLRCVSDSGFTERTLRFADGFNEGEWVSGESTAKYYPEEGESTFELTIPEIPFNGTFRVEIMPSSFQGNYTANSKTEFHRVSLQPETALEIGRTYRAESDTNKTGSTDKGEIEISSVVSRSVINNIFHVADDDPLRRIFHTYMTGIGSIGSLARIKSYREIIQQKRRREFTGDVYGFLECQTHQTFNGIHTDKFVVTAYEFNTSQNTGSIEAISIEPSNLACSFTETPIYGSTIEPTITQ